MADVVFTDAALDDLRRIGPEATPKVLKKILMLVDEPWAGHPLGGELTGFRKLVVGRNTWRVVYRITDDKTVEVCEVWAIGARAEAAVYAEATARLAKAPRQSAELHQLAAVIERLGRLADSVKAHAPLPEPVPDWLAHRLIHTAGLAPAEVAALSLEEAVDRWTAFISKPR